MYSKIRPRVSTAILIVTVLPFASGCAAATSGGGFRPDPEAEYVIYDTALGRYLSLDALAAQLVAADVVLFGENHDDAIAHGIQLDLFDRVSVERRGTLGMEMFERDVQATLDDYSAGRVGEDALFSRARPWPNYRSDYRPILELAIARGWGVTATNLPQRTATAIAREGLDALGRLDGTERAFAAATVECPADAYWTRFVEAMFEGADSAASAAAHAIDTDVLRRTYEAQCSRDETMAETISSMLQRGPVFHLNGAFHSDFGLGIVPRLARRSPEARVRVISAVPADDPVTPPIAEHRDRADYVIFTRKTPEGAR